VDLVTLVAESIIGAIGLTFQEVRTFQVGESVPYWGMVRCRVEQFPAGVLGELIASENTLEIPSDHSRRQSGREVLVDLATAAVVARMVEMIERANDYIEEPIAS
jgi:hypothetical protein